MGVIIAAIKSVDFPIEVKRAAYCIVRNETSNGLSIIGGTNVCGAQSDSGLWGDKWTSKIIATMVQKENMTGKLRGFLVFNSLQSGIEFLCDRIAAKGIFIGEHVDGKYHKGDVTTPEQEADAYQEEWVLGEVHNTTKTEIGNFVSMYNQAKAIFIMLIAMLFFGAASAQKADTVIKAGIYTSYFSYELKEPLYVVYKLYKGGGDNSRDGIKFKTGGLKNSATAKDYAHNGYDEGHLANAEDFAGNAKNEEKTFRFYNCLPQTARMNRGIWKTWETIIREDSQTDSLKIICGGIFSSGKTIGKNKIAVPDSCFKIVYSLSTKKLLYSMVFPNDNSDTVDAIDVDDLKRILPFPLSY